MSSISRVGGGSFDFGSLDSCTTASDDRLDSAGFAGNASLAEIAHGHGTIGMNTRGDHVRVVQQRLVQLGYSVGDRGADGWWGQNSMAGCRYFQKARGIPETGVVDFQTLLALDKEPARTKDIQTGLQRLGYDLGPAGVDGKWGRESVEGMKAFQRNRRLPETGLMDSASLRELERALNAATTPTRPPAPPATDRQTAIAGLRNLLRNPPPPRADGTDWRTVVTTMQTLATMRATEALPDLRQAITTLPPRRSDGGDLHVLVAALKALGDMKDLAALPTIAQLPNRLVGFAYTTADRDWVAREAQAAMQRISTP